MKTLMKTNGEIRRENLHIAVERMGKAIALAEKAGISPAYLSQIKQQVPESKTGKPKMMGDEVARRIEVALGVPTGWMDVQHTSRGNGEETRKEETRAPENMVGDSNASMIPLPEIIKLLTLYNTLNEPGRQAVLELMRSLTNIQNPHSSS